MHTMDTHTHTRMDSKLCTYSVSEVGTNSLGGGPVRWMAPESILKRKYSFSSDVYAFGVSACTCVCDYSASMRVCARTLRFVPQVMSVDMRLDNRCANICFYMNITRVAQAGVNVGNVELCCTSIRPHLERSTSRSRHCAGKRNPNVDTRTTCPTSAT